jgi:serine/threonine-protein kinase ULK/ATG1
MMAETLCGSPLYMAPEILRYEKYDAKVDLWSVGAVVYEMAVGKAPFRAQNHIELLKKIEQSKGLKFPDEEPNKSPDIPTVPPDIKKLIRALLKRTPTERATFDDFFSSTALAKSKFPRPREVDIAVEGPGDGDKAWKNGRPPTPDHHKQIPPEVLDPNALIPPSKFHWRRAPVHPEADDAGPSSTNKSSPKDRCAFRSMLYQFILTCILASLAAPQRKNGDRPSHRRSLSLAKFQNLCRQRVRIYQERRRRTEC